MSRPFRGQRNAVPFVRHISVLALGTVLSQAMLVIASILLARLYTPTEFGEFAVALSLAMILATLATLRLEMAVPLAEDDREAVAAAASAVFFAVTVSLGLLAILAIDLFVTGQAASRFGAGTSIWFVPPAVAALGALASARMLQSRRGRFSAVSVSRVTASLVQSTGQVVASPLGAVGLSAGFVAGAVWNLVSLSRRSGLFGAWRSWRATAAKWRRHSLHLLPPSVLNTATVGAVAPVVALFYGVASSGLFTFSFRILALPATVIGQAVSGAFFPKMAELERRGQPLTTVLERAVTGLTMVSVPIFGLVVLLGPELFGAVFGSEWRAAGDISAVLAPWLAVAFISSPLSSLMMVKNQLRRLLALSVIEAVLRLGSLAAGLIDGHVLTGVAAYSLSGCAICLYYVGWSLRLAGSSLRAWAVTVRLHLLAVGGTYPALLAVKGHLPAAWFGLLAGALTLIFLAWAVTWLCRHALVRGNVGADADVTTEPGSQGTPVASTR